MCQFHIPQISKKEFEGIVVKSRKSFIALERQRGRPTSGLPVSTDFKESFIEQNHTVSTT